jgi:hypothetical protein
MHFELHPNNMNRVDGFCRGKSWKLLICSLKDRRKPPSHDSSSGISAGPHRPVNTVLIRAQTKPSPSTHQPPPWCLTLTCQFCPTHPYTFSCLFREQQNLPILNSISCLLLVYSVIMWEASSFILSHGRANGNWGPLFHFPPASYIIRNSD